MAVCVMLVTNYFYFLIQACKAVILLVRTPLAHGLNLNSIYFKILYKSTFFLLILLSLTHPKF